MSCYCHPSTVKLSVSASSHCTGLCCSYFLPSETIVKVAHSLLVRSKCVYLNYNSAFSSSIIGVLFTKGNILLTAGMWSPNTRYRFFSKSIQTELLLKPHVCSQPFIHSLFSPFTHPHIHPSISPSVPSSVHPSIHLTMQLPTHPPNHLPTQPKIKSLRAKGDHAHKFTDIVHRMFHFRFFITLYLVLLEQWNPERWVQYVCMVGKGECIQNLFCIYLFILYLATLLL